ncbi:MAG: PDDEXK nuclease domain-containing protein [Candidatus Margulisiibacteriota bacterium]
MKRAGNSDGGACTERPRANPERVEGESRGSRSVEKSNSYPDPSFGKIKALIDKARYNALKSVNSELVSLYWNIGSFISKRMKTAVWGKKTIDQLAEYLNGHGADYKGFNRRNLYRMRQFYETYQNNEIVSPLVTQLSWSKHLLILSKTKSIEEKEFYIQLAIRENYSKKELERQLDSAVYERTLLSSKLMSPSKSGEVELRQNLKDSYVFEFLGLQEGHDESDLQKGLIRNLKLFLLELGKDFLFISEEFRIQVGTHDYYIDLLFFHRELKCLVAFELKITDFKPEHLGKLNFYLEALDRDVKKPHENPSIGILLCKGKDSEVVEYALNRFLSPAMVSEYSLKLPDKKLLREKLHYLFDSEKS